MMTDQVNYAEKIKEYQKILAQDSKSLVFIPLAGCFLKSGLNDDALETALKGTWELPEYAPGFVAVARIYAQRQVSKKAISAFNKALSLDPSCLDAYKGLARLFREQGDIDAASNLLTKAVFLFPDEPSIRQMLESLAPVASPPPTPIPTSAVTAPVQAPSKMEPITTGTIAEIYIKQGLYDKALEVYRELYSETNDPAVAQKIAEIQAMSQGSTLQTATEAAPVEPATSATVAPTVTLGEPGQIAGESVLDNLNSMLASIQARRNRV